MTAGQVVGVASALTVAVLVIAVIAVSCALAAPPDRCRAHPGRAGTHRQRLPVRPARLPRNPLPHLHREVRNPMITDTLRTPTEIHARIAAIESDDWLGFRRGVLIPVLPLDEARRYLKPDAQVTEAEWSEGGSLAEQAPSYLEFAIGKIEGHRGISADRSVGKLTEFAWLLGRDDVVAAMDEADYAQYGAPKVKAFALGMGYPWPDGADLNRMADGSPCRPDCEEGCGW